MNKFKIKPWFGIFGFLGILGLIPINDKISYFNCIFFSFFSLYWWGKLNLEANDERLKSNMVKSQNIMSFIFCFISFLILFLLDRGVHVNKILLLGSIFYSLGFILTPAIIFYFDKVQ